MVVKLGCMVWIKYVIKAIVGRNLTGTRKKNEIDFLPQVK